MQLGIALQKGSVPSLFFEMWYGTFLDKYMGRSASIRVRFSCATLDCARQAAQNAKIRSGIACVGAFGHEFRN